VVTSSPPALTRVLWRYGYYEVINNNKLNVNILSEALTYGVQLYKLAGLSCIRCWKIYLNQFANFPRNCLLSADMPLGSKNNLDELKRAQALLLCYNVYCTVMLLPFSALHNNECWTACFPLTAPSLFYRGAHVPSTQAARKPRVLKCCIQKDMIDMMLKRQITSGLDKLFS